MDHTTHTGLFISLPLIAGLGALGGLAANHKDVQGIPKAAYDLNADLWKHTVAKGRKAVDGVHKDMTGWYAKDIKPHIDTHLKKAVTDISKKSTEWYTQDIKHHLDTHTTKINNYAKQFWPATTVQKTVKKSK